MSTIISLTFDLFDLLCQNLPALNAEITLLRDAMDIADYAVARCPSVRLSITRQYYVKTAQRILKRFAPSVSHTTLVFPYKTL